MKMTTKLLAASALFAATVPAMADLSANVGVMSDYYFRGVIQNATATTTAGLDYESNGFYIGTWAADVEDGLEVDVYLGYGMEFGDGFSAGIGYTTYQYTGDFDSEYNEVNLSFAYNMISFEHSIGEQGKDSGLEIAGYDYTFTAVTVESDGFFAKYGTWGDDASGDYWEIGYGTEVGGFDVGVSILGNDKDLDLLFGKGDEQLLFTLGKSFDL